MSPTLRENSLFGRRPVRQVRAIWIVYWIALFALMHTPKEHLPQVRVSNLDKAVHTTAYLLLGLLCGTTHLRSGAGMSMRWFRRWILVFAAYAAIDELTQPFVNRTASVVDWSFDMLGVVLAMGIIAIDVRRARRDVR